MLSFDKREDTCSRLESPKENTRLLAGPAAKSKSTHFSNPPGKNCELPKSAPENYWILGDRNRIKHMDEYTLAIAVAEDSCVAGGIGAYKVI